MTADVAPSRDQSAVSHDDRERLVAQIWAEVLGREVVGLDEDFFELGGDSIMSIQIVARLRRRGWQLSTRAVFEYPTVRASAAVLEAPGAGTAEQGELSGEVPLLGIQRWFLAADLTNPNHWNQSRWVGLAEWTDTAVLAQAARHLPRQHDALRMRFGAGHAARYTDSHAITIESSSAGTVAEAQHIARTVDRGLDLENGPLLAAVVFPHLEGGPAMFITVHHLVMDVVSWAPLLDDWAAAYEQLRRGDSVVFGPKSTSVRQWAALQSDDPDDLDGSVDPQLPVLPDFPEGGTRCVERRVDAGLAERLSRGQADARLEQQLAVALAHGLHRTLGWEDPEVTIEGHGRHDDRFSDVDLSRTVGWFTVHRAHRIRLSAEPAETLTSLVAEPTVTARRGSVVPVLLNNLGRSSASSMVAPFTTHRLLGQIVGDGVGASIDPANRRLHRIGLMSSLDKSGLRLVWDHHPDDISIESFDRLIESTIDALTALAEGASGARRFDLADLEDDEIEDLARLLDGLER